MRTEGEISEAFLIFSFKIIVLNLYFTVFSCYASPKLLNTFMQKCSRNSDNFFSAGHEAFF